MDHIVALYFILPDLVNEGQKMFSMKKRKRTEQIFFE